MSNAHREAPHYLFLHPQSELVTVKNIRPLSSLGTAVICWSLRLAIIIIMLL
jgi:hypothetical protein